MGVTKYLQLQQNDNICDSFRRIYAIDRFTCWQRGKRRAYASMNMQFMQKFVRRLP